MFLYCAVTSYVEIAKTIASITVFMEDYYYMKFEQVDISVYVISYFNPVSPKYGIYMHLFEPKYKGYATC